MRKILLNLLFIFISFTCFGQVNWNIDLFGQAATDDIRYSGSWSYITADSTEYALVGAKSGLAVFPIDDPMNMNLVGWIPGPETNWRELTVLGHYAFVVTDVSGMGHSMQVVDLSFLPDSVHLVTSYDETFTKGHIIQKDIFTDDPYVYINGTSSTSGVHILDVNDPENPVEIGLYEPGYYIHDCHVRDNILFACAFNDSQVDIVDISDKTNPTLISILSYDGDNTHSCFTSKDGNYLFVADELDGLPARIFDISDLINPIEVAQYSANLTSLVHNPYIKGDFAYISHNTEGLRIVDIADPELPVEVGFYDTWPGDSGGFSGLWSACPFFPSGKIIGANRHDGLYVWTFNETRAARIYGRVFDAATGENFPGSLVNLTSIDTILTTDFDGQFKYGLLTGSYNLTVEEQDYFPVSLDFELMEGDSIFFEIGLENVNAVFEQEQVVDLKIAPNPMKKSTLINMVNLDAHLLQIVNLHGQLIQTINIANQQEVIFQKESLEVGTYLILAISEEGKKVGKGKIVVVD